MSDTPITVTAVEEIPFDASSQSRTELLRRAAFFGLDEDGYESALASSAMYDETRPGPDHLGDSLDPLVDEPRRGRPAPRARSFGQLLRDVFARYEVEYVGEPVQIVVAVPLAEVHAPGAPGSSVTVVVADSVKTEREWSVKVLGSGLASSTAFTITEGVTLRASADGSCELALLQPVVVSRVRTRRRGGDWQTPTIEVRPVPPHPGREPGRVVRDVVEPTPYWGQPIRTLGVAPTQTTTGYAYEVAGERSTELTVGFAVPFQDAAVSLTANVSAGFKASVEGELPPGWTYELWTQQAPLRVRWRASEFLAPGAGGG